jgi:transposase
MIDQARIDKATELILGGMMYKDVAAELHVSQVTISQWSKKGLIPPTPVKKKNHQPRQGQVRGAPAGSDRQPTPGRVAHHRGARET